MHAIPNFFSFPLRDNRWWMFMPSCSFTVYFCCGVAVRATLKSGRVTAVPSTARLVLSRVLETHVAPASHKTWNRDPAWVKEPCWYLNTINKTILIYPLPFISRDLPLIHLNSRGSEQLYIYMKCTLRFFIKQVLSESKASAVSVSVTNQLCPRLRATQTQDVRFVCGAKSVFACSAWYVLRCGLTQQGGAEGWSLWGGKTVCLRLRVSAETQGASKTPGAFSWPFLHPQWNILKQEFSEYLPSGLKQPVWSKQTFSCILRQGAEGTTLNVNAEWF